MSKLNLCLAAGVLMAAGAFASGAETPGESAEVSSAAVQQPAAASTAPAGGGILLQMTTGFVSGGQEKDGGTAGQASTSAVAAVIPDSGPVIPVNQCFCVVPRLPSPTDPLPYYIGELTTVSPLCKKIKLKFDGRPIFEQLIFCKELGGCWQSTASWAEKRRRLEKTIAEAREKPGACDKKCREARETEMSKLARESEEIEQGGWASMERCVSGAIARRKQENAGKNQGGGEQ